MSGWDEERPAGHRRRNHGLSQKVVMDWSLPYWLARGEPSADEPFACSENIDAVIIPSRLHCQYDLLKTDMSLMTHQTCL